MYTLNLDSSPLLNVAYRNHTLSYSTNGSLPNPLEATYAALAACAGVYTMKACKSLGIPWQGIGISLKPVANASTPLMPTRIVTSVSFPAEITPEQRSAIQDSIQKCAVKELIRLGADIDFATEDVSA